MSAGGCLVCDLCSLHLEIQILKTLNLNHAYLFCMWCAVTWTLSCCWVRFLRCSLPSCSDWAACLTVLVCEWSRWWLFLKEVAVLPRLSQKEPEPLIYRMCDFFCFCWLEELHMTNGRFFPSPFYLSQFSVRGHNFILGSRLTWFICWGPEAWWCIPDK